VTERLRQTPGIERVSLARFPLLSGDGWNGLVSINGATPGPDLVYFLNVSRGWLDTMQIPLLGGHDFRETDTNPGVAIVNQAFARQYFKGENPVGKSFQKSEDQGKKRVTYQIVGLVRDARYRDMREPITPTAYVPFHSADAGGALQPEDWASFIVRTSAQNPLALAAALRQEVSRAHPAFRVSNIRTQVEINESQTIRERLLAMLALFFALVALLLAGIGLYGVLDYSVLQRRREIGIRMAIGARAGDIVRRVTIDVFSMVLLGAVAGLALGTASVRYIESLFYQVKATDLAMLALPALTLFATALLAALPPVIRAVRVDPVETLRAD
jgi:putative ABC transport system permease protein